MLRVRAPWAALRRCALRPRALSSQATEEAAAQVSELAGKDTRELVLSAFSARAMAAIKYEYFALRAEVECEVDAAATFRSLTESSKQQAIGFLEILEDYGDADYDDTLANVEASAARERELADATYPAHASAAAKEGLDHVDQWFQDLGDASARAAERLEMTAAMLDPDAYEEDDVEQLEHVEEPEGPPK